MKISSLSNTKYNSKLNTQSDTQTNIKQYGEILLNNPTKTITSNLNKIPIPKNKSMISSPCQAIFHPTLKKKSKINLTPLPKQTENNIKLFYQYHIEKEIKRIVAKRRIQYTQSIDEHRSHIYSIIFIQINLSI